MNMFRLAVRRVIGRENRLMLEYFRPSHDLDFTIRICLIDGHIQLYVPGAPMMTFDDNQKVSICVQTTDYDSH